MAYHDIDGELVRLKELVSSLNQIGIGKFLPLYLHLAATHHIDQNLQAFSQAMAFKSTWHFKYVYCLFWYFCNKTRHDRQFLNASKHMRVLTRHPRRSNDCTAFAFSFIRTITVGSGFRTVCLTLNNCVEALEWITAGNYPALRTDKPYETFIQRFIQLFIVNH